MKYHPEMGIYGQGYMYNHKYIVLVSAMLELG